MKKTLQLPELTTKAKIIIGLVACVFLGSLILFVILSTVNSQLAGNSSEKQDFKEKDTVGRKTDALTSADSALKAGDTKRAQSIYDSAVDAEPDGDRKVRLVIDQSRLLYANGKLDDAITVAKNGENYGNDKYLISDWLGQLHEAAKKYNEAASYYAQAGATVDSKNSKGYTKQYYDNKVAAMKVLAGK